MPAASVDVETTMPVDADTATTISISGVAYENAFVSIDPTHPGQDSTAATVLAFSVLDFARTPVVEIQLANV